MQYTLVNKKVNINLTDKNYVSEGGEGKLYKDHSMAFKIYFDPSKGLPLGKIKELSVMDKPNIIRPIDVLVDKNSNYVGYAMNFVENSIPLCKLFTNPYRDQNHITPKQTLDLIRNMQDTLEYIHQNKCLVVDGNEFNYLVDAKTHILPYFIDTDSWQTPNYPATAILPSIRDLHNPTFNELTDWFSFGIIACQLFVGIHPYKGNHPNFKKNDLEGRMRSNISIFNRDVTVPSAVRDFAYIPTEYRNWFVDIFDRGLRIPPPYVTAVVQVQIARKVVSIPIVFHTKELYSYANNIVMSVGIGNDLIVSRTEDDEIFINHKHFSLEKGTDKVHVSRLENTAEPILVRTNVFMLDVISPNKRELLGKVSALDLVVYDDIIMCRTVPDSVALYTIAAGNDNKMILMPHIKSQVLPNATQFFQGCLYMDALGKPYLYLPFKNRSQNICCTSVYIKELEGYRVLDAKHDNHVVMVIVSKNNKYGKFIFRFSEEYDRYDSRYIDDIMLEHPNFVTLPSGVVVHIKEDGVVEVFHNHINAPVNVINDSGIITTMRLFKNGAVACFYHNNKIYNISNK